MSCVSTYLLSLSISKHRKLFICWKYIPIQREILFRICPTRKDLSMEVKTTSMIAQIQHSSTAFRKV